MHPRRSAQEVLICDICETVPVLSHCEVCNINLCVNCVGKHISDSSKNHNVVPFSRRKSTPNYAKCPKHIDKHCKHYCEKCDIPVCITCVSSGKHKYHDISDILEKFSAKLESLQNDLEELVTGFYPQYEEMESDIQNEKSELEANYGKLIIAVEQQGEILHREVTAVVNQRKSDIQEMKNKHLSTLNKNTEEITPKITELKLIIADLKSMLKSNDASLTSTYKSRNSEFRTLPPKGRVRLPHFTPEKIDKDQLSKMLGSLSSLSINTEHGDLMKLPEAVSSAAVKPMKSPEAVSFPVNPMKSPEAVSSPPIKPLKSPEVLSSPVKPMLDEPRFRATINTGYRPRSVSCLSEELVWTRGNNKTLKLLNLQGKLLTSIKTKSGNESQDIAVTRGGDLVYTDHLDRTVNLVKDKHIRTIVTLRGWKPLYVCSTTGDDLLVTMVSDDGEESKIVRYSASIETQTIQFDDLGHPLYSSGSFNNKYISENKNLDICVADSIARAVVVVSQSRKLRFRYTGYPSNSKEPFNPHGITTDSQSHILIADSDNHRIHILDQGGQFLRCISNLHRPHGLCVDYRDNLFVAEWGTAKVRKIQYLKTEC